MAAINSGQLIGWRNQPTKRPCGAASSRGLFCWLVLSHGLQQMCFKSRARCPMQIKDRIKELRRVRAGDLKPHPKNWRVHPESQRNALRGLLAEIGYADTLLSRELPDGGLQLIDGHLRAETTPDVLVPVLVTDLTEEEAEKVL